MHSTCIVYIFVYPYVRIYMLFELILMLMHHMIVIILISPLNFFLIPIIVLIFCLSNYLYVVSGPVTSFDKTHNNYKWPLVAIHES